MRKTTEDIILEELFNLSHKFDKIQETMTTKEELKALEERMATREDIKAIREEMATKEDLKNYATKEDIKDFVTNTQLKKEFDKQAEEIAQIFHNTFSTMGKREKESERRILNKVQVELESFAKGRISC